MTLICCTRSVLAMPTPQTAQARPSRVRDVLTSLPPRAALDPRTTSSGAHQQLPLFPLSPGAAPGLARGQRAHWP